MGWQLSAKGFMGLHISVNLENLHSGLLMILFIVYSYRKCQNNRSMRV